MSTELPDAALKGCEDLLGDAGLTRDLKIKLPERMPGAQLTAHAGREDGKEAPPAQADRRNGVSRKVSRGRPATCRWLYRVTTTAVSRPRR